MSKRLSSLATAVLLGSAGVSLSAVAEAPMAKTQAPAFMRVMLGDFEVTTISDGTVKLPLLKLLIGQPEQLAAAFKKNFLKETVEVSVNAFLINTGSKLVLIDTGAAGFFGPTLGNIVANLKASGYQPEQVDEIYITHMHSDHVGW
jgi:glyoxylase-like metal-dependent hydrolase (beta-lactamase superfamily II)